VVQEISWAALKQSGSLLTGEVVTSVPAKPDSSHLRIYNPDGTPKTVQVLVLNDPGIRSVRYCVQGSLRCDNVAPGSYLEMCNYFPSGGAFFTRTLDNSGPMRKIEGSSDWRPFLLPFFSNEESGPPSRLEVNVVFAGSGAVWLSPLRLVQYDPNENPLAIRGAWWSDQQGGLIGAIAGTVFGCMGGLIGTLAGLGKARRLVVLLMWAILVFGIGSLLFGAAALILGQPYAVYFPLLLLGVILSGVIGPQIPMVCRRYEQIELRRMAAMDAADSSR
jgi:hypothetical protein